MRIDPFFQRSNSQIHFTRQQASDFAKQIADDFNPLHNIDAKRFCVPGDLLFALVLFEFGLSQHMHFRFSGMVTDTTNLLLPSPTDNPLVLKDSQGKNYLDITRSGSHSTSTELISRLVQQYVTFSGSTFPHVLVPLLEQQNVMINQDKPMVIYQSMLIDLATCALNAPVLRANSAQTTLQIDGKRGKVCLAFDVIDGDAVVGRGEKHMLLSGLCPYDATAARALAEEYALWKSRYLNRSGPATGQSES